MSAALCRWVLVIAGGVCLGGAVSAAPEPKDKSPESNNKDKIVGKWKATALPDLPKGVPAESVSITLEFTADGKMMMDMDAFGMKQKLVTAKYRLGSENWVHFSEMKPVPKDGKTESKDKVVIDGDKMTLENDKGKMMGFTRIPEKPAGPAKKPK